MKKEYRANNRVESANYIKALYNKMLHSGKEDRCLRQGIVKELLDLQKENGSWSVIDNLQVDGDCVIYYAFEPTYYATAALICHINSDGLAGEHEARALKKGLDFAMQYNLAGHGYDATGQQIEALSIYKNAGLYSWLKDNKDTYPEVDKMINDIIAGYREALLTGRTYSDWDCNFAEQFQKEINNFEDDYDPYVWYAAYGSNINSDRLMRYISRCPDQSGPTEEKAYILPHNIYFAYHSSQWGRKGVAFLDDTADGKAFGKVYKIKSSQLKHIQKMEGSIYSKKVCLELFDTVPVYTFTSPQKRQDVNSPSPEYLDTILKGLRQTYSEISPLVLEVYLYGCGTLDAVDKEILGLMRNSRHGLSLNAISRNMGGGTLTKVRNSVRRLKGYGLIKQDSRSAQAGCRLTDGEAIIYTRKNRRELIDILLLGIR